MFMSLFVFVVACDLFEWIQIYAGFFIFYL